MPTAFGEILTEYAMVLIDDLTWRQELQENPARFFRAKSMYVLLALPRFNRPPEAQAWLAHTPPTFDDYLYTAQEDTDAATRIETGKTGFELCCVTLVNEDKSERVIDPSEYTYDVETGAILLDTVLKQGQSVECDFYSDGVFESELPTEMKRILALCIQTVWENRFSGEYLSRVQKITDKTFATTSESTWTREQQAKATALDKALASELLRFEENLYYRQRVPAAKQIQMPK